MFEAPDMDDLREIIVTPEAVEDTSRVMELVKTVRKTEKKRKASSEE